MVDLLVNLDGSLIWLSLMIESDGDLWLGDG